MGTVRSPRTLLGLALLAAAVLVLGLMAPLVWPAPGPSTPPSSGLAQVTASAVPSMASGTPRAEITLGSDATPSAPAASTEVSPSPVNGEPGIVADRLVVPRLDIDLPVVEGDGIDAPLHMAAHYPGTSWPGGGSNIYIYAHARQQMFQNLWNAQLGDLVFVDLVDGSQRVYQVSKIEPDIPWDDLSVLDPTSTEQLTLQTCTGTQDTDPRFLVIATPVS